MKRLASFVSAAILASAPVAASAMTGHSGIRSETVFLADDYSEVGRWIFYCDGGFDQVGETSYRQYQFEYSCPE